jgi:hypothetical protein
MDDLTHAFEPIRDIATHHAWPGVEESTSYGTPALKVKGHLLLRIREPDVLVVACEQHEKEFLKQADPEIYFETPHYHGYDWILIRISKIDREDLAAHIEKAWRRRATKKMVAEFDSRFKGEA